MFTCGRALYSELTTETKSVLLDCSAKAESVELTKISTADSVLVFESARSSVQQSAHKSTRWWHFFKNSWNHCNFQISPCKLESILNDNIQVNLCQKLLFLHQLTHKMTTDCSLNYKFNTWKVLKLKKFLNPFCFAYTLGLLPCLTSPQS